VVHSESAAVGKRPQDKTYRLHKIIKGLQEDIKERDNVINQHQNQLDYFKEMVNELTR
jgi:hypothetical protein